MFVLENWVDWCSVLGFALSVLLAIREIRKSMRRLDIQDAEVYAYNARGYVYCVLRFVLANRSLDPISISSVKLVSEDGYEAPTSRSPVWLLRPEDKDQFSGLRTNDFPISLQGMESAKIALLFPLRQSEKELLPLPAVTPFRVPDGSNPKLEGSVYFPVQGQKIIRIEDWDFQALLHTSRGPVRLRRTAAVYPAVALIYECGGAVD